MRKLLNIFGLWRTRVKEKYNVEIDDTTLFGVPHHNHDYHRVYICRLTYEDALLLKKRIEDAKL